MWSATLQLCIIEYIVVFWLNDILISTKTQRDGSYKIFCQLSSIHELTLELKKQGHEMLC